MGLGLLAALAGAIIAAGPTGVAPGAPTASPRDAFDRGRTAFERAEYKRAIEILHPLVYPDVQLEGEGELVQAHRMLGVAYLFENKPEEARREFQKLLQLRPEFRFDPLLDSQRVVTFFEALLKEEKAAIDLMMAAKQQRDRDKAEKDRRAAALLNQPPTIVYRERHSLAVAFIPFGAGQFQNGEPRKGWWLFGTESTLAAVSLGAFVTNFALYGVSPDRRCLDPSVPVGAMCPAGSIDHSQEETSRWLLRIQLASGVAFFGVAIWGVIDALRNFKHEVPLEAPPRRAGADRAQPSFRLTLSPNGLGAAWAF